MKEFFKNMLSSESNVSSKRVMGMIGLLTLDILATFIILHEIFTKHEITDNMVSIFWVLGSVNGGLFGVNALEKFKK